jgi:hypothetical protein
MAVGETNEFQTIVGIRGTIETAAKRNEGQTRRKLKETQYQVLILGVCIHLQMVIRPKHVAVIE